MRRFGSVLFFAALSLALHLAWVFVVPRGEPKPQPTAHWVELSFEEPSPPSPPEPPSSSPAEPAPPGAAAQPPIKAPAKAQRRTELATAQPSAPGPAQPSATQPAAEQAQPSASQPAAREQAQPSAAEPSGPGPSQLAAAEPRPTPTKPLAILPRAAALTLDPYAPGNTLRCGQRELVGQTDCAPSEQEIGQAAQAGLNRELEGAANHVAHLKPREAPKLKRRSDGSYAYDGHVFQALVRPDGTVEFRDNATQSELRVSPVPFRFTADIHDLVERQVLGRELYSAEKQWLLDQTRELRERLASEYRRREQQGANRELERTLRSVLDDASLTLAKKHETIFLLWQDCGEDAQAQLHREAVDRFVRRYMPQSSPLGFLAEELERFNASRKGLQRFEPYAGS